MNPNDLKSTPEPTPQQAAPTGLSPLYRVLAAAALSAFLVSVPLGYALPTGLTPWHLGVGAAVVLLSSALAGVWGEPVLKALEHLLESFSA